MAPTDDGHSMADELKKLHQLVEFGAISKEDFQRLKKKVIMGVSAPVDEQPSDGRAWERKVSRALSEAQESKNFRGMVFYGLGMVIMVIIAMVASSML